MQTTNPLNYLFAAYAAIWIILAIYIFSIQFRERELRNELNRLKQLIETRGTVTAVPPEKGQR